MEFWGRLIQILDTQAETPKMFGIVHIISFALSILLGIWLCYRFKNADAKTVRKVLLVLAIIAIVMEIYKQVVYTFTYRNGIIETDYQWYAFPFQFCSIPMYVQLLAALIKNKRIHDALCAFLATYSIFAGLCVMIYPEQVFIGTIGVNIQTMFCHGSMISLGIFLFGSGYVKAEHKTILKAIPVFASAVAIAMIMNEVVYLSGILNGETFNMFFISPHFEPSLPVYSLVQAVVPFPWCTVIYIAVFSLAAYIILLLSMGIQKLRLARQKH